MQSCGLLFHREAASSSIGTFFLYISLVSVCFQNLRVLALNFCNIQSWAEVQILDQCAPNLQELYLANNKFPDLQRACAEKEYREATGVEYAPPSPPLG